MPKTTCDLYRGGNASTPKMDNVRTITLKEAKEKGTKSKDAIVYNNPNDGGKLWVYAKQLGISTFDNCKGSKNWWKLKKGFLYNQMLYVVNDHGDHYSWQAAVNMSLDQYKQLLKTAGDNFNKIKKKKK